MTTPDPVGQVQDAAADLSFPIPPPPESLKDTGLSESQVTDLMLKTLYQRGSLKGNGIADVLALPFAILDELLLSATQRHFVEVLGTSGHGRGGYLFNLTEEGRRFAEAALRTTTYVGPAPVPLEHFAEWVKKQSVKNTRTTLERLEEAFHDLILPDEIMDSLGPAVNSGASIFLHGAPGNGKTALSERLGSLVSSEIYIPHTLMVSGHNVVVFDPVFHRRVVEDSREGRIDTSGLFRRVSPYDRRFERVRRPTVFVGGELTIDQLDLQLHSTSKVYQAPFQVKASGGVLIVDDFGRQRISPAELLNRWIVPLEKGFDNLTLETGVRFPVPFDCILIFATNLNPRDLVDEAFLRRIQFKVELRSPDRKAFEEIFRMNCREWQIEFRKEAIDLLFERYYEPFKIHPRGCHPRDILHHIRSISGFAGTEPSLDPDLLDKAARGYFLVMEEQFEPRISSITTL